jgi:hypothetical protein
MLRRKSIGRGVICRAEIASSQAPHPREEDSSPGMSDGLFPSTEGGRFFTYERKLLPWKQLAQALALLRILKNFYPKIRRQALYSERSYE